MAGANTSQPLEFNIDDIFDSDACKIFAKAWANWRRGGLIPNRNDIALDDIREILSQVAIIEVHSPKKALLRLVGTSAKDISGTEVTGLNWIDLAPPEEQEARGERIWNLVSTPCASQSIGIGSLQRSLEIVTEFAAFPVAPSQPGAPTQVMACFQPLTDLENRVEVGSGFDTMKLGDYQYLNIGAGLPTVNAN